MGRKDANMPLEEELDCYFPDIYPELGKRMIDIDGSFDKFGVFSVRITQTFAIYFNDFFNDDVRKDPTKDKGSLYYLNKYGQQVGIMFRYPYTDHNNYDILEVRVYGRRGECKTCRKYVFPNLEYEDIHGKAIEMVQYWKSILKWDERLDEILMHR